MVKHGDSDSISPSSASSEEGVMVGASNAPYPVVAFRDNFSEIVHADFVSTVLVHPWRQTNHLMNAALSCYPITAKKGENEGHMGTCFKIAPDRNLTARNIVKGVQSVTVGCLHETFADITIDKVQGTVQSAPNVLLEHLNETGSFVKSKDGKERSVQYDHATILVNSNGKTLFPSIRTLETNDQVATLGYPGPVEDAYLHDYGEGRGYEQIRCSKRELFLGYDRLVASLGVVTEVSGA